MQISKSILNDILKNMPSIPPEVGGILGGKEGRICVWRFDKGYSGRGCVYCPNVEYLNRVIEEWDKAGFEFMGMIHVHFGGAEHLSNGDKNYIKKIMNAMPYFIKELYFPVVVQPAKEIVSYKAIQDCEKGINIISDIVEVF